MQSAVGDGHTGFHRAENAEEKTHKSHCPNQVFLERVRNLRPKQHPGQTVRHDTCAVDDGFESVELF